MSRAAQDAFLAHMDAHKGILYTVANAWCARREDRPDLIQDIVMELWRAWPRFDGRAAFSTWMYRIAVNVAISAHRHAARRIRDALPIEDFGLDLAAADRAMDAEGDDLRALHQLIARLPPLDRALVLLYLEGQTYEDIADTVGLSPTNVATRLNRIRQRLQQAAAGDAP